MNDHGYVYVLMNPSMKNLVKIGKTKREPDERAQELSSTTGVPTPFVVVYDCYFESCSEAEVFVHTYLENKGFRVSSNREFFEIPIKDAIDSVMKAKEHFGEFDKNKTLDNSDIYTYGEPWDELLEKAKSFRYGIEDIQDDNDAIEYYLKAIKLGYVEGYQDIADIYYDAGNPKKSFEYYKKAVNNGVYQCYTDIASYYLYEEKDFNKALQSYEFYMKHTEQDDLYCFNIVQYFKLAIYAIEVIKNRTDIVYFEKTIKYKNEILEYMCIYRRTWSPKSETLGQFM